MVVEEVDWLDCKLIVKKLTFVQKIGPYNVNVFRLLYITRELKHITVTRMITDDLELDSCHFLHS